MRAARFRRIMHRKRPCLSAARPARALPGQGISLAQALLKLPKRFEMRIEGGPDHGIATLADQRSWRHRTVTDRQDMQTGKL
jgi:hypothetical protein